MVLTKMALLFGLVGKGWPLLYDLSTYSYRSWVFFDRFLFAFKKWSVNTGKDRVEAGLLKPVSSRIS